MPGIGDLFRRVARRPPKREEPDSDWPAARPSTIPDLEIGEAASRHSLLETGDAAPAAMNPAGAPPWEAAASSQAPLEPERPGLHRAAFAPDAGVAVSAAPAAIADDDVLHEDHLLVTCPYCGMEDQRVGGRCSNERCNQVIVRLPTWAQRRRQNWLARRWSWRRVITACLVALFVVFVVWVNYPFAPNPAVLIKQPLTQMTIDTDPGPWAAAGRDLRHSRHIVIGPPPPSGKITAQNAQVPGEPLESEPVAQDTHIFVGSSEGIYALSHHDLAAIEKWEGDTPGRITGSAAVVDSNLFFGSTDHTVNSWNAYDGRAHWSFPAEDTVEVSPVISDGFMYISSGESWVYALDAHDGAEIWSTQLESNASDAVAINDGRLYVGDDKGIFYTLSARTGQELFRYRTPRAITGAPVISADGKRAYFTSGGQLYAVDARIREIPGLYQFKQIWAQLWWWQVPGVPRPSGQQGGLWRFTPENPLQGLKSSPALAGGEDGEVLYVGGHDHILYALDAIDGALQWEFVADDAIWASPLVVKDQVIFGDDAGNLYSLNRDDGSVNWNLNLGSKIRIPPVASRGLLIVRTADGTIFGIE